MIRENEVIAVPGAEAKETVAYQIAVQAVPELADKELLSIYMPMTHDAKELEENHRKGAKALEEVLDQGKDIVFLTLEIRPSILHFPICRNVWKMMVMRRRW